VYVALWLFLSFFFISQKIWKVCQERKKKSPICSKIHSEEGKRKQIWKEKGKKKNRKIEKTNNRIETRFRTLIPQDFWSSFQSKWRTQRCNFSKVEFSSPSKVKWPHFIIQGAHTQKMANLKNWSLSRKRRNGPDLQKSQILNGFSPVISNLQGFEIWEHKEKFFPFVAFQPV